VATGDFHLHSTCSDGVRSPTWVMETAAANGVRILALTDHDTTEGQAEARAAAETAGLRLIPGIELSVDLDGVDAHLLGFGFDVGHEPLQAYLGEQREGRVGRMKRMVRVLAEHGVTIEAERVQAIAGGASVGRPHVARALVEAGYVESVAEAFNTWLGDGKPAHITRDRLTPAEAIALLHEAGGVAFVAHPVFLGDDYKERVAALAALGLDGMETYYKHYDEATVAEHEALSEKLGLARSGGSDYHGLGNPNDREIGDIPFEDGAVAEFVAFLEERAVAGLAQAGAF
jgi:hypothetical protein